MGICSGISTEWLYFCVLLCPDRWNVEEGGREENQADNQEKNPWSKDNNLTNNKFSSHKFVTLSLGFELRPHFSGRQLLSPLCQCCSPGCIFGVHLDVLS